MNNMPLQMHRIPKAPAASKSRRPTLALFALFVVKLLLFRQAKRVIPKKEKGYIKMDTSNATSIQTCYLNLVFWCNVDGIPPEVMNRMAPMKVNSMSRCVP